MQFNHSNSYAHVQFAKPVDFLRSVKPRLLWKRYLDHWVTHLLYSAKWAALPICVHGALDNILLVSRAGGCIAYSVQDCRICSRCQQQDYNSSLVPLSNHDNRHRHLGGPFRRQGILHDQAVQSDCGQHYHILRHLSQVLSHVNDRICLLPAQSRDKKRISAEDENWNVGLTHFGIIFLLYLVVSIRGSILLLDARPQQRNGIEWLKTCNFGRDRTLFQ